jgi:hypothetical protein
VAIKLAEMIFFPFQLGGSVLVVNLPCEAMMVSFI